MRDILNDIEMWRHDGKEVALATVVETWGSAPRGVGAKMGATKEGSMSGSVSGGCVEGAVVEASIQVLESGQAQLLYFGVADEAAWDVGLACGGSIRVFVEKLDPELLDIYMEFIEDERRFAIATVISGPSALIGSKLVLGEDGLPSGDIDTELAEPMTALAGSALAKHDIPPNRVQIEALGEPVEVFVEVITPPPTLVMVGGVHIAIALSTIARALGYKTLVIDPRRAFGSQERFEHADQLIQKWPDKAFSEYPATSLTAVVILTHDPKIDDAALHAVLAGPAFYVGALGSRKTHRARIDRLAASGIPAKELRRIHAPIGIDIGAQSPEEIAVAIMAEIVASRRGV